MNGFHLLEGKEDPAIKVMENAINAMEEESEDDDNNETVLDRNERILNIKADALANYDEEHGDNDPLHGDLLGSRVNPKTSTQLDTSWWFLRGLVQSSSNAYGQIKILAPSIHPEHELRSEFEIIAKYGNF